MSRAKVKESLLQKLQLNIGNAFEEVKSEMALKGTGFDYESDPDYEEFIDGLADILVDGLVVTKSA